VSRKHHKWRLYDAPDVFGGMAELATCYTGTQTEVANTDCVVFELVREIVFAFGHGTDEDADALFRAQSLYVVGYSHNGCFKAQSNLAAIRWQMVSNWILNYFEELLRGSCGTDGHAMQQLNHEAGKALESARDPDGRIDFDEDAFRCVDVNLKPTGFVDWRIEKREKTLRYRQQLNSNAFWPKTLLT